MPRMHERLGSTDKQMLWLDGMDHSLVRDPERQVVFDAVADKRMLEGILRAADEIFPDAVFAVHLDHGDSRPAWTASRAVSTAR